MLTNENLFPPISSLPQISEQVKKTGDTNESLLIRSVTATSLAASKNTLNNSGSNMADAGIVFAFGKLHSQQSLDAKTAADNNALFSMANALLPLKFFLRVDFITSVACGDEHSAFISNNGRVFVIGKNSMGQLGLDLPLTQTVTRPTCIKSLKKDRVYRVGCGTQHTLLAIETSDGNKQILAFGINSDLQLGIGKNAGDMCAKPQVVLDYQHEDILMLSGGHSHSAALLSDQTLLVWGSGPEGQLGLSDQIIESEFPVQLIPPPGFSGFTAVACGYYHTLTITTPPALFACGEPDDGKLGLPAEERGSEGYISVLKRVTLPENEQVTAISAGGNHSLAVTSKGHVYVMGSGTFGQLGVGTSVSAQSSLDKPSLLRSFADSGIIIKSVSAGETHSAFATDDGRLFLCGNALHARLGFDVSANSFSPRLANLVDEATAGGHDQGVFFSVTSVACGGCHTVCLANKMSMNTAQLTKPFGDTTNFTTTSTFLTTSSTARSGRRARRSAAQSLNLTNTTAPSQLQNLVQIESKSLSNLPPLAVKGSPSIVSTIHTTTPGTTSTFSPVSTLASDHSSTAPIEQTTTMAMTDALNSAPPKLESSPVVISQPVQTAVHVQIKEEPPPAQNQAHPPPSVVSEPTPTTAQTPITPENQTNNNNTPEVAKLEISPSSDLTPQTGGEESAKTPQAETPKPAPPPPKKSGISLPLICGNKKQTATPPVAPSAEAEKKTPEQAAENKPPESGKPAPDKKDEAPKEGDKTTPGETKTTAATTPTKTCAIL